MWQSKSGNREERRERRAESRESPYTPNYPYWPNLVLKAFSLETRLLLTNLDNLDNFASYFMSQFPLGPSNSYCSEILRAGACSLFVGINLSQIMRLRLSHTTTGQLTWMFTWKASFFQTFLTLWCISSTCSVQLAFSYSKMVAAMTKT